MKHQQGIVEKAQTEVEIHQIVITFDTKLTKSLVSFSSQNDIIYNKWHIICENDKIEKNGNKHMRDKNDEKSPQWNPC